VRTKKVSIICGLLAAALIGLMAPVSKLILGFVEPITASYLFLLGSATGILIYWMICAITGRKRDRVEARLEKHDLPWVAGAILFDGILAPLTLLFSLRSISATNASMLLNFEAVGTAIFAAIMFREAIGPRIWGSILLVTGSCVILSWNGEGGPGFSLPALGILLTCVFYGLQNNLSRKISDKDPVQTAFLKGLVPGVLLFLAARIAGEAIPDAGIAATAMLFGFVGFGGLVTILFLFALRGIGAARSGSLLSLSPFFGVGASFLILHEVPGQLFLMALPLMIGGTYLLVTERHSHHHGHVPLVHDHRHRHDDLHHDHDHPPGMILHSPSGEHSHLHAHEAVSHQHPHTPDLHHGHDHGRAWPMLRLK
jgi:drug/metabolite transporter (DMT)-like permease